MAHMACEHPKESRIAFYPATTGGTERCLDCGEERQQTSRGSEWWWDWKHPRKPGAVACLKLARSPEIELCDPEGAWSLW